MGLEKLPFFVHEQFVAHCRERAALGEAERCLDGVQVLREHRLPSRGDLHAACCDLPGVAHARVVQGLCAQSKGGRVRHFAKLMGCLLRDWKAESPDAHDRDFQFVRGRTQPRREGTRGFELGQQVGDGCGHVVVPRDWGF